MAEAVLEDMPEGVMEPIDGDPRGKNLLSMTQFDEADIAQYIDEALAAEAIINDPDRGGVALLPFHTLKAVMRQPSTRTADSMSTAMTKLGGSTSMITGMESSAEAKGETREDSWIAFAAQAPMTNIIGTRTHEELGPAHAAAVIKHSAAHGKLPCRVPVINLGDGKNEHPTQALGDLFTMYKVFGQLEGLRMVAVGDHARYRAFHSLLIGAATVGMEVTAVQSPAAPVPGYIQRLLGSSLHITEDLDEAMREADILYMGRNPGEYAGEDEEEIQRHRILNRAFASWVVDRARLQQMPADGILVHPRPRGLEVVVDVDEDPRARDVQHDSYAHGNSCRCLW